MLLKCVLKGFDLMTHDMNFVISSNLSMHQQRLNDLQSWTESLLMLADTSISVRDKTTMTNASILKCFGFAF